MTILQYITPSRMGGAEEYFLRLVKHLNAAGHRVIIVTKRDCTLREEMRKRGDDFPGVELHGWKTNGKFDLSTLNKLKNLIRRENVDLVHTHLTTASWLGAWAGKSCGVPVVAHIHGADSKTWFQFADYLVAVAEGVRSHVLAQGVDAKKVPVLYYGIDLEKYAHPMPTPEAKTRLGLSPSTQTVGIIGSLITRKGHRHLLDAIAQAEKSVGEIHALFAGEGDQLEALKEQARVLNIENRVHFLGFRDDAAHIMAACDVVALPSYKEGLSIAMMEAMALGRPVIVTNVAGMPELVQHDVTGLMTEPGDVAALTRCLNKIFAQPDEAARLAQAGKIAVQSRFDQTQCLARVEKFLDEVQREWKRGARVDGTQWRGNRVAE